MTNIPLLLLVMAAAQVAGQAQPDTPLASEIASVAERPLPTCGVALTPATAEAAIKCAKTALEQQRPFIVQLRIEGIDSVVWVAALQLPSGHRYFFQHDDFGLGHLIREQCKTFIFSNALQPIGCER